MYYTSIEIDSEYENKLPELGMDGRHSIFKNLNVLSIGAYWTVNKRLRTASIDSSSWGWDGHLEIVSEANIRAWGSHTR